MSNYILVLGSGKIHNGNKPCYPCRNAKECNKKYFDTYENAVNFYEGKNKKGEPCGRCLKELDK